MTTIKDVPMFSSDEKEIELNSILYTGEWEGGHYFRKEGKFEIEAHRVISVDNTRRFFRTRCAHGCETTHSYDKGCERQKLFGSVENCKKSLMEKINKDAAKCHDKADNVKQTLVHIVQQKVALTRFDGGKIKLPKAVKE